MTRNKKLVTFGIGIFLLGRMLSVGTPSEVKGSKADTLPTVHEAPITDILTAATISPTQELKQAPTARPTQQLILFPTTAPATIVTTEQETSISGYSGGDVDCPDFSTHTEAQTFFISHGGPESDPHRLDGDNDGIACENLP